MPSPAGKIPPFSLSLQPSRWMAVYWHALHGLLLLSAYLLPLQWSLHAAIYIFIYLFIAGHWVYYLWRFFQLRSRHFIQRLSYGEQGWLLGVAGQELAVDLLQATIWPWLVVANFRELGAGRRHVLLVFPDSAPASQRRQLRVLLRHMPVWS